jgi:rubredoxin/uncharacterized membrane protein
MKKWKCTVCGYIHEGVEPPEECPVCGADRSKFVEIQADDPKAPDIPKPTPRVEKPESKPKAPGPLDKYKPVTDLMAKIHAHPIAVHIPNGVLPVAVFFLFLSLLFHHRGFEAASFYNLVFVVFSMPVVILTGVVDWKVQFKGAMTRVFKIKITCAAIVSGTGVLLTVWKMINPDVTAPGSNASWVFILILLVMLAAAATAGYFGGKLVFRKK